MSNSESAHPIDFESVKTRLAEIADMVDDETVSLDEALALYEEAVVLGLQASDLLETGIVVPEEPEEQAVAHGASTVKEDAPRGSHAGAAGEEGQSATGASETAESTADQA